MTTLKLFVATISVATVVCATARAGEAKGTLGEDEIRKVVRDHIDEVRVCYNAVLAKQPEAKANLVVDFTIGSDGAVTTSKIGTLEGPAELGKCVSAAVLAWKFPKPTGGAVDVSYPFAFEPG